MNIAIDLLTLRAEIEQGARTIDDGEISLERDVAIALLDRIAELEARRDALLATVAKVANLTPFADEAKDALEQRGKLIAEIGTLKSTVINQATQVREALEQRDAMQRALLSVRRELAEQHPLAMLARQVAEWGDDDDSTKAAMFEIRLLIANHAKQTEAAKLEYLPSKFRGAP